MPIKIAQRLKPFSHLPGTRTLIPGSTVLAEIYPTRLRLYDFSSIEPVLKAEVAFSLTKVVDFTVQLDLEKGRVAVFGKSGEEFFRYFLHAANDLDLPALRLDKFQADLEPLLGTPCQLDRKTIVFSPNPKEIAYYTPELGERIFLGVDKKQNWERALERNDPREMFPFLFRLGQLIPYENQTLPHEGTYSLLHSCFQTNGNLQRCCDLLQVGFESLLVPGAKDTSYRGFELQPLVSKDLPSPLILPVMGTMALRRLFLQVEKDAAEFLPHLPAALNHGRFINFKINDKMTADLIWKKQKPMLLSLTAHGSTELNMRFPNGIKRFRLREKAHHKGTVVPASETLQFEAGRVYLLDKFER